MNTDSRPGSGVYRLDDTDVHGDTTSHYVAPGAAVIGNVSLGHESSVWFNAVLRGDNETIRIGDGSNIQDGSVLHTDIGAPLTIGRDVTIGHMVMLHGCTIGDNALVGIGAVILNHATIAPNSIVGAGSLVPEGKSYPEGVLVLGTPAKVVRELTAEEIASISDSAKIYRDNARRFAAGLSPGGIDIAGQGT